MNEAVVEFERIGGLFGLVLFLLLSSVSCKLPQAFGLHSLQVSFPILPESWSDLPLDGYMLIWCDEKGEKCSAFLKPEDQFRICVPRGVKQSVLAYPMLGSQCFRPLGALYPYDVAAENVMTPSKAEDLILLSANSGYVALVAEALKKSGFDPWAFALDELSTTWEKRGCDPWQLDPSEVAEKLASAEFRETLFQTSIQDIELPQGLTWWPESPFAKTNKIDTKQYASLSTGISKFLTQGAYLIVQVSKEGEVTIQVSKL